MLARSGIKRDQPEQGWWSRSKAGQAKNRRRYFAFRRGARAIVNGLIPASSSYCPGRAAPCRPPLPAQTAIRRLPSGY